MLEQRDVAALIDAHLAGDEEAIYFLVDHVGAEPLLGGLMGLLEQVLRRDGLEALAREARQAAGRSERPEE